MQIVKQLIKRGIRSTVACLPQSVRHEVIETIAADLKICGFVANGEYGLIQGGTTDRVILPQYARTGIWSPQMIAILNEFFDVRGGTYLDIGANIGLTTIPVARNPSVTCLAFEPEPRNFANLSSNIALNCPHRNVQLFNFALYHCIDKLRFEMSPHNFGDYRIRTRDSGAGQLHEQTWKVLEVDAVPLDEIVQKAAEPIAVKIDTQGAEPFVIAGGQHLLRQAELLFLEFWPYGMARMGGDPKIVIDFLRSNFTSGAIVEGDTEGEYVQVPIGELADRMEAIVRTEVAGSQYFDVIVRKKTEQMIRA